VFRNRQVAYRYHSEQNCIASYDGLWTVSEDTTGGSRWEAGCRSKTGTTGAPAASEAAAGDSRTKGSTEGKVSSAITVTDKEGVPHTSRIGPAVCAAGCGV
jgi:hypothetical protein